MSTKQGKAVPMDHEVPDGTAVISIVHPEGNPKGVTVEETVIKDNAPRPSIGTNVGEALEQALQKDSNKSSKTKTKKGGNKMEETTANKTTTNNETKSQAKPSAAATAPKAEQELPSSASAQSKTEQSAAPEEKQELASLVSELRSLKNELGSTPIRVEHHRSIDNTGKEAGHQFLVGLAAGAGVALGVTAITTVAWLIQRKIAGSGDSAE